MYKKMRSFMLCALSCFIVGVFTTKVYGLDTIVSGTQKVVIVGEDWGPAVVKTILMLDTNIDGNSIDSSDFAVTEVKEVTDWASAPIFNHVEGTATRTITDAYLSDDRGNKVTDAQGKFVTLEMEVDPNTGSPFIYDVPSGYNNWCAYYKLQVTLTGSITSQDVAVDLQVGENIDLTDPTKRISIGADEYALHTFTATTGKSYSYGEYTPQTTSEKSPLVIWLHGAGEGGSDNYIDLLGNEVTALNSTEFQDLFDDGTYVLTPQSPTMWMDGGDGQYQNGDIGSLYTEDLMELITSYVNNNPNIDPNRIIIGGCSNGGYMTMEMILTYPEYFAAAYPICEAFSDEFITDEQIQALIDNEVGIWFTHALNDPTVNPQVTTIPTYTRLIEAGAKNVHISLFDTVLDTTGRFTNQNGTPYAYNGHWSWIYFFNNENFCDDCEENEWVWLSKQAKSITPIVQPTNPDPTPKTPEVTQNETKPKKIVATVDNQNITPFIVLALISITTIYGYRRKRIVL